MESRLPPEHEAEEPQHDPRLYLPDSEPQKWNVGIQMGSDTSYCSLHNPGEEFFHLIVPGELYLERDLDKCCLRCAVRHGLLTNDRLFWQKRANW